MGWLKRLFSETFFFVNVLIAVLCLSAALLLAQAIFKF